MIIISFPFCFESVIKLDRECTLFNAKRSIIATTIDEDSIWKRKLLTTIQMSLQGLLFTIPNFKIPYKKTRWYRNLKPLRKGKCYLKYFLWIKDQLQFVFIYLFFRLYWASQISHILVNVSLLTIFIFLKLKVQFSYLTCRLGQRLKYCMQIKNSSYHTQILVNLKTQIL